MSTIKRVSATMYDHATDAFCRALGFRTQDVLHLAVGPNGLRARCVVRTPQGDLTGDEAEVVVTRVQQ